jgi:hypothetical protein
MKRLSSCATEIAALRSIDINFHAKLRWAL